MFTPVLPFFVGDFRVYTVDRRGHGRTPDVEGPYSYETMADDVIAFLDKVVGGPAHLVGHSDGADVALLVALKRPDLVRRLVLISGLFHYDGNLPGTLVDFDEQTQSRMSARHGEVSPDGEEHFPVIARKVLELAATEPLSPLKTCGQSPPVPWSWAATTTRSRWNTPSRSIEASRIPNWPSFPAPRICWFWKSLTRCTPWSPNSSPHSPRRRSCPYAEPRRPDPRGCGPFAA
ncbi:alpha/beta fold hydrolase [Catenulispora yoronensis]